MRRSILSARPSRSIYQALVQRQQIQKRGYAIGTKDTSPPSPIEPSQEQAHPIGPFYESILNGAQPIPAKKPEVPPVTSKTSPANPANQKTESTAPPTPAGAPANPPSKPASEPLSPTPKTDSPKPAAAPKNEKTADVAGAAPEPAAEKPAPAKRGRKPKVAKSVAPSSSPASSPAIITTSSDSIFTPSSTPPSETKTTGSNESDDVSQAREGAGLSSISDNNTPNNNDTKTSSNTDEESSPRISFARSLEGPAERAERLAAIRSRTVVIAGVAVPPKPEEPDNCCMSGCVNCVWDRYRDEMEEWASASAEAERRLKDQEAGVSEVGAGVGDAVPEPVIATSVGGAADTSMDDDGGGSASNWAAVDLPSSSAAASSSRKSWDEELYKNVPVGIREFMKQEKKLKEKHMREGTAGG